jgi:Na+-transporting NADH:ubiquinone oxidoreductase subunit NqrB
MALFANQQESKRPTFIAVICILSFVLNGFSFVNNMSVFNEPSKEVTILLAEMQQQQVSITKASADEATKQQLTQMLTAFTATITTAMVKKMSLFSVIAAIVCLIGTSLMWRMKKLGFHFFIVGTLISILAPFILFGGNGLSLLIAAIMSIIWLILLGLFAVNLKFME